MKIYSIDELTDLYEDVIKGVKREALESDDRSYGGVIRITRGYLLEFLVRELVKIAWVTELKQDIKNIQIDSKKEDIYMSDDYVKTIDDDIVQTYLAEHKSEQVYKFGTDVRVMITGRLALAIECKTYTENAMLKRIIFDAGLMKELHPEMKKYYLIQVQSQLGGDYSELPDHIFGSPATNTLLSRSPVPIEIITLVQGERKVNEPIYEPKYYRPINKKQMEKVVNSFVESLRPFTV